MLTLLTAALLGLQTPRFDHPTAAEEMTASADQVELRLSRSDGQNIWEAGPYSGTFQVRGSASNIMNIRTRNRAQAELTVNGPEFSDGEIGIACSGGQGELSLGWITFDRDELSYVCTFTRGGVNIDARLELALERRGGLFSMGRNDRAGALSYEGGELRFRTERLSGAAFPTGRVPGYAISSGQDVVAGMDYRVLRPLIYLPPEGDDDREAAFLAALILALFMDPANMD